jgi:3-hydroxybutyryl-CoA dehydrogenase
MGHGIAVVHAIGGCSVTLYDLSSERLGSARRQIAGALKTLTEAGALSQADAQSAEQRISYEEDFDSAVAHADVVVECVTEDIEVKRALYLKIAGSAPATAILASNTSYLEIFPALPPALEARSFIVHWYTPPYIIDLVDIVPAPGTAPELAASLLRFIEDRLGKKPVLLKCFISGYLANRIQMAIESEAFRLLDAGVADVADIDRSISQGLGLRLALLGQFRKIDYTGLRVVRDSHRFGIYEPPKLPTGSRKLEQLVEKGQEGVLAGSGFYDYEGQSSSELFRKRDLDLLALKATMAELKKTK